MSKLSLFLLAAASLFLLACQSKLPDKKEIGAAEIIALLDSGKDIYLVDKIVLDDLDFTLTKNKNKITKEASKAKLGSSITFIGCVFMGKLIAYNAQHNCVSSFSSNLSFLECDFRDSVDFTEAIIDENVFFSESTFREVANMQAMYVKHKKAYFSNTVFEKEALFQNTKFLGDVDFSHSSFKKAAMFQKLKAELLFFGDVTFDGYVDLSYTQADDAIFNYSSFNRGVDFSYARFRHRFEYENTTFTERVELNGATFQYNKLTVNK